MGSRSGSRSRSRDRSRCGFRRRLFLLLLLLFTECVLGTDIDALLALKSSMDPSGTLQWRRGNSSDVCKWQGVKECIGGTRVSKLVLENMGLSGTLDGASLNRLDQLRVLSLKQNSLSGQIPDLSGLANLKSLYLSSNNFTGNFPASVTSLHRLKILVLSSNRMSGGIPETLLNLSRLYILYLDDNRFTGGIPPLNQTSLRFFNVSNNQLSGQVPVTPALLRFNASSYSGNADLCIPPCNRNFAPPPTATVEHHPHHHHHRRTWLLWVTISTGILLLLLAAVLLTVLLNRRKNGKNAKKNGDKKEMGVEVQEGIGVRSSSQDMGGFGGGKQQGGFSWEGGGGSGGDGVGTLVFCGEGDQPEMSYSLEDLLKASAETLGRGTMGSTYKAVMESGFIVTVKRLKDGRYPRVEEFRRHIEVIGKLRHPNLVPLRAYFQARDERLLVYDYFPNGSLFSLIHGSRSSASGKPLHWTSCLKIAEDLASGLLYIHQNPGLTHGNLKSSNVLLGSDFESCLTDYGLMPFKNLASPTEESSASSLYYRAPECRDIQRSRVTQQADVYSFGVLLLELLTGKTPFQDLVSEHGSDIPRWVKSVREEAEYSDEPASSGNEASDEKLGVLLSIAMSCVSFAPENRPVMREVLRMIKEIRAEAQVSSNSSDHSPGRWSDTVQSLPRNDHLSI